MERFLVFLFFINSAFAQSPEVGKDKLVFWLELSLERSQSCTFLLHPASESVNDYLFLPKAIESIAQDQKFYRSKKLLPNNKKAPRIKVALTEGSQFNELSEIEKSHLVGVKRTVTSFGEVYETLSTQIFGFLVTTPERNFFSLVTQFSATDDDLENSDTESHSEDFRSNLSLVVQVPGHERVDDLKPFSISYPESTTKSYLVLLAGFLSTSAKVIFNNLVRISPNVEFRINQEEIKLTIEQPSDRIKVAYQKDEQIDRKKLFVTLPTSDLSLRIPVYVRFESNDEPSF
ncbi:MAG: hypothetical protein AB7F43_10625 [Bacteriovoracia bacterium]